MDPSHSWYEANAKAYAASTVSLDVEHLRQKFLRWVPGGGLILDVGCGSGRDARRFLDLGFQVEARDWSASMAEEAARLLGSPVVVEDVRELRDVGRFDGIWASAVLLHLHPREVGVVLERLARALRPNGALFVSVKEGSGRRSDGERTFWDWEMAELSDAIRACGLLEVVESETEQDSNRVNVTWICVIARRSG
jgi:SAM-dependent methyltransferase